MSKKVVYSRKWICTDSDQKQYGRQLSENLYEFKEKGIDATIIDMTEGVYEIKEVESCINSYGYTLLTGDNKSDKFENINELYGDSTQWIIAECLFECGH